MAATAEYGPQLQSRISPLMTGVGPIEAAISITRALACASATDDLPHLSVLLGSAGSASLTQTAIYQASSVSWRDIDASALGFARGVTPFLDQPAEIALPVQLAGLPSARLSTGSDVVSRPAYAGIDADMVDMESFAVLRACQQFNVPLMVVRGISDGVANLSGIDDWTRNLGVIDARLADAVDLIAAALKNGSLRL